MANSVQPKSSPSPKKRGRPPKAAAKPTTVLDFWDGQAKQHGTSDLATNPDQHYRKLEIERVLLAIGNISPNDGILDVGCGNGHSTLQMAETFPDADVLGVDFSPEMIKQAESASLTRKDLPNVQFCQADILSLSRTKDIVGLTFDVVVSTRCLINLANWDEQKIAILEMRKMLKPDGRLILVENFKEGLANLNMIRGRFGLAPVKERWHNNYIPDAEFKKFIHDMRGQLTQEYVENIGNMYYMASRVIYAKMCADQGIEPDYDNPINAIASQMPSFGEFYACSPNFMVILKNEAGQWASNQKPS